MYNFKEIENIGDKVLCCKFIKTFAKIVFSESIVYRKEMRFSKKPYFKIKSKLPTLIVTQRTMARNNGFQLIVFKV